MAKNINMVKFMYDDGGEGYETWFLEEFIEKHLDKLKQSMNEMDCWTLDDLYEFKTICTKLGIAIDLAGGVLS